MYGVDVDALDQRLRRFREKFPDGAWTEDLDRKRNAPKYLYQESAIQSIIDDLRGEGRA